MFHSLFFLKYFLYFRIFQQIEKHEQWLNHMKNVSYLLKAISRSCIINFSIKIINNNLHSCFRRSRYIFHFKLRLFTTPKRTHKKAPKHETEADHYVFPDILWPSMHETKEQQLKFENRLIGPFVLEILSHVLDVMSNRV